MAKRVTAEVSVVGREWENWDVGRVAHKIQSIWSDTAGESAHRIELAGLVSRNLDDDHASVLEVGCGTGLVYEKLKAALPPTVRYTGVDVSVKMLEIARANFPAGRFLYGDGYELVFRDREFDVVLCFEVLGHIPEIEPFFSELLRVTDKTCIFTVWPSDSEDVVESDYMVDDVRFLHRRYSNRYLEEVIDAAWPETGGSIEVAPLDSGGRAYIVRP
jgi:ubiquinone/menaquinone biosynthesis C-methylase UbiE